MNLDTDSVPARLLRFWQETSGRLGTWLGVPPAGPTALPFQLAADIAERTPLSALLPYVDYDDEYELFILDNGRQLRAGFVLQYAPFTSLGTDIEGSLETLFTQLPADSTVQAAVLSLPDYYQQLAAWRGGRAHTDNAAIGFIAGERSRYLLAAGSHYSLVPGRDVHPRALRYYCTVTIPYTGAVDDRYGQEAWLTRVARLRETVRGAFEGIHSQARNLRGPELRRLLRQLVNPHFSALELDALAVPTPAHLVGLVERQTRMVPTPDGPLLFEASSDTADTHRQLILPMTVDGYPPASYLPLTALLIGAPDKPDERIAPPFWLYTNVIIRDSDKAQDRLRLKLAGLTRQLMGDSPAYKALMSHLFEMRDDLQRLVIAGQHGHPAVQAYTGINLWTTPDLAHEHASNVRSMWKQYGFRVSPERAISLPVWLASLPGGLTPDMDPPGGETGLQRGSTMHSLHATTLMPMRGDWTGSPPDHGGLLLVSRLGQPAVIDVQDQASDNYNFVIVAASGSGKSFMAQDLVVDFLSRGGLVYVIDSGRSYYELAETVGGQNLVFDPANPFNLNPFGRVDSADPEAIGDMTQVLKPLMKYMAWPEAAAQKAVPDWEYSLFDRAIAEAWRLKGPEANVETVAQWFTTHEDERVRHIADQLHPYAIGRFARWFSGAGRPIDLSGGPGARLVVTELDELDRYAELRDVVFVLLLNRIAQEIYLKNKGVPKLLLIDEAWKLLAAQQAGEFIEAAFRTVRKYQGSAGVITQGFPDFDKSPAARAAYDSAAWLFCLRQKPASLDTAFTTGGRLASLAPDLQRLVRSLHTAKGAFSEVFVQNADRHGLYRFYADPYSYWLYTTNPQDKQEREAAFQREREKTPNATHGELMARACRALAGQRYKASYGKAPGEFLVNRL